MKLSAGRRSNLRNCGRFLSISGRCVAFWLVPESSIGCDIAAFGMCSLLPFYPLGYLSKEFGLCSDKPPVLEIFQLGC
jgi:hypothetical protein